MKTSVKIIDNTKLVQQATDEAIERALEACGLAAEGYAKTNITKQKAVETGNLRNSITHKVVQNNEESVVYIGTPVEYAPYIEMGTGKYYPGGRRTAWPFIGSDGNEYWTRGMPARPYLKPAITEHIDKYKQIITDNLQDL